MNPIMEHWVGSVRLSSSTGSSSSTPRTCARPSASTSPISTGTRPHTALTQASPLRALPDPADADVKAVRRDRLGGLLHEYAQFA
jgi:putative transposase